MHRPLDFSGSRQGALQGSGLDPGPAAPPATLHLAKAEGLTVGWSDGTEDFFPLAFLRRHSPSAEQRELQRSIAQNPLTVLPTDSGRTGPLRAESAELVGNYALRIVFSDGHKTGLYSWSYLRSIAPAAGAEPRKV